MADKPHSKRALDIVTTRQGARSKRRPDVDFGLSLKDLTNFFMPLYRYSWKGYGHNNAVWHTMKSMTNIDATTPIRNNVQAGDCVMLSCLPGRQVYAEFNALPLLSIYDAGSTYHGFTNNVRDTYQGYAMPLLELAERALLNNTFFPLVPSAISDTSNSATQALPSTAVTADFIREILQLTSVKINSDVKADREKLSRLLELEIDYEGGFQSHKFTNTTSLPVYVEVREFMPKVKLGDTMITDIFGTNGIVGGGVGVAYSPPGIRDTLTADLARQKNKSMGVNATAYPDNLAAFDELDDKAFKYNRYCKMTNERFVVGDPVHHRIDPGHTWTYTMLLPAFKVKMSELFEFNSHFIETSATTTTTNTQQIMSQPNANGASWNTAYNNYSPKFSKFISVRITGSKSWTSGAVGSGTPTVTQHDAMTNDGVSNLSYINSITQTKSNNGVESGPFPTGINPYIMDGVRTASHAVNVLHEVAESHGCRIKPMCHSYHKEEYNWLPNANNRNMITQADEMGHLDPEDNEVQTVAMDN